MSSIGNKRLEELRQVQSGGTPAPRPAPAETSSNSIGAQRLKELRQIEQPLKVMTPPGRNAAVAIGAAFTQATIPTRRADGARTERNAVSLLNDMVLSGKSYNDWYNQLLSESESAAAARDKARGAYQQAEAMHGVGRYDELGNYLGETERADLSALKAEWDKAESAAAWAAQLAQMGRNYRYEDLRSSADFAENAAKGNELFTAEAERINAEEEAAKQAEYESYMQAGTGGMAYEQNLIQSLREDTTWREPREDWTQEERDLFGYLYNRNKEEAFSYAENLNNNKNAKKAYEEQQRAEAWATKNFGTGALATGASVLGQAFAGADYLDSLAEYAARGTVTQRAQLTPADYGNVMTGAIAETLNNKDSGVNRMLEKLAPVFGDVGAGDLYQVGYSVLQNMTYAYTTGGVGSMAAYFGIAAKGGYEDAVLRGATPGQALTMGFANGLIEAATEAFSVEGLLKLKSTAGFKGYLKNVAKQALTEASEETVNQLVTPIAEALVLGDKSAYRTAAREYMMQGMSREEADKAAFKDWARETAWSAMSGALSGGISGGISTGWQNISAYKGNAQALINEGLAAPQDSEANKLAQKYAKDAQEGRSDFGTRAGQAAVQAAQKAGQKLSGAFEFSPSTAFENQNNINRDSINNTVQQAAEGSENAQDERKGKPYRMRGGEAMRLIEALDAQNRPQIKAQVESRLQEAGASRAAMDMADIVTDALMGGELTAIEKARLKRSPEAVQVLESMGKAAKGSQSMGSLGGAVVESFDQEAFYEAIMKAEEGLPEHMRLYTNSRNQSRGRAVTEAAAAESAAPVSTAAPAVSESAAASAVQDTGAESVIGRAVSKGRISVSDADSIIDSNELSREFFESTGVELTGTRNEKRSTIQDYVRREAYNRKEEKKLEAEREELKREEESAEAKQAEAEAKAKAEAKAVKESGYGSYIRGVLQNGVNATEAREIASNSEARAMWEAMTGKTLPENTKSAVKMIMETRRKNAEIPKAAVKTEAKEENKSKAAAEEGQSLSQPEADSSLYTREPKAGTVTVSGKIKNLTARQEASIKVLERVAGALGISIYIEPKGLSSNGWYDPKDGSIHIAIDAGRNYEGSLLFTVAHELTHFIKDWSEEKYKVLSDFVFEQMELSGADVGRMIAEQMRNAEADDRQLSAEEAYDEVVADSMQRMLMDGSVVERLEALRTKDESLFKKVKAYFAKLFKRIEALYKGLEPGGEEAKIVEQMSGETFKQLQDYFADALADAGKNYRAAGGTKNTTGEGGVRYSFNNTKSGMANDGIMPYTEELQSLINQGGNVVVDSYGVLVEVVNTAMNNPKNKATAYFGNISTGQLAAIESKIANLPQQLKGKLFNVKNSYSIAITFDTIRHIAAERKIGTSEMVDYLDRLADTILDADSVNFDYYTDSRSNKLNGLLFKKKFPDGNLVTFEIVSNKKKSLNTQTMYIQAATQNKRKSATPPLMNSSSAHTPEARGGQTSNEKIPQPRPDVKHQSRGRTKAQLEEEIEKLNMDVQDLKKLVRIQKRTPEGTVFRTSTVDSAAKMLMEKFSAEGDRAELRDGLMHLYKYIARGDALSWKGIKAMADPAVAWLLRSSENTPTDENGRAKLERQMAQEVYDSYWRVSTLYTTAAEYERDIEQLKAQHKENMEELRRQFKQQTEAKLKSQKKELLDKIEAARKKNAESKEKTSLRQMIWRQSQRLKIPLERPTKTKNIKEGMQGFVKSTTDFIEALFADKVTAEDMIKSGFAVEPRESEEQIIKEARELLREIDGAQEGTQRYINLQGQYNRKLDKLSDLIAREREAMYKAKAADMVGRLADSYRKLEEAEEEYIKSSYDPAITSYLEWLENSLGNARAIDLSVEQLRAVYDGLKMIHTTVRNVNEAFQDKSNLRDEGKKASEEIKKFDRKDKRVSGLMAEIKKFGWGNIKPVYAFELLGSKTFAKWFKPIMNAEGVWGRDVEEAKSFFQKTAQKHGYDKWDMDKVYTFESTSGKRFELRLEQMLTMYAYTRRGEQAIGHLQKGGFVFDPNSTATVQGKFGLKKELRIDDASTYNVDYAGLLEIANALTDEQRAFVEEMQRYLSVDMGAKGNQVSEKLYGVKLFKEARYFPLRVATQYMERARDAQRHERKIKNSGFSKPLTPQAGNPVVLSNFMDLWNEHINEMSMYHAFVLPLEDFYRVYNFKVRDENTGEMDSVNASIQNAFGRAAADYIDQLLTDINGGARRDPRASLGSALVSQTKKAATMASLSVVAQQPSAIGRAFALINPKYFSGRKMDNLAHKARWEQIKKYAPVAVIKEMGYFDTSMGRSTADYIAKKEYKSFADKVKGVIKDSDYRDELLGKLPSLADELTWCAIWEACKRETADKQPQLREGSEEFLQYVGDRFTEVIQKTQVYDSVLSRSANMRSKDGLMNTMTAFMAEPTTTMNMVLNAIVQGRRGDKDYARKAMGGALASVILNAALASIVYAMRDDDDYESFLEKYLSSFTTEVVDGINPLTYFPIIKDVWSLMQGYDVERSDMSMLSDLISSIKNTTKILSQNTDDMTEEQKEKWLGKLKDALWKNTDYITAFANVPLKNIRRDINAVFNFFGTVGAGYSTSSESLWDAIGESVRDTVPFVGFLPEESKSDRLYAALTGGDGEYAERLLESYADDSARTTAIRRSLRDNDERIREAAAARLNGDVDEYVRIYGEILDEGVFERDDIIKAIESEMNSMTDSESESSSKSPDLIKAKDYYRAILAEDADALEAAREAYTQQELDKGKLEEDAESGLESGVTTAVKTDYLEGALTRERAMEILVAYGGKTEEDAEEYLDKQDFQKEYGFAWSEKDDAYRRGEISVAQLEEAYVEIEGISEEEARYEAGHIAFTSDNPELRALTINQYRGFYSPPEGWNVSPSDMGIDMRMYAQYRLAISGMRGIDEDGDGEPDRNSKKNQILAYIDSLPLSEEQKDLLYYQNGYASSQIKNAPWH